MSIVSIIGAVCFIAGFGALNLKMLKSDSYLYQILNLIGALCFTYSAFRPEGLNWGLFITEAAWALIGLYAIYKIISTKKNKG